MDDYTREQRHAIALWKRDAPGILSQASSLLPERWARLAGEILPEAWLDPLLQGLSAAAARLVPTVRTEAELATCDRLAESLADNALALAAAEGATTGLAGLPGLALDLPALLALLVRTILAMGGCYGFAPDAPGEKEYALAILAVAAATTRSQRQEALALLERMNHLFLPLHRRPPEPPPIPPTHASTRLLARQLRFSLLKRKALQALPLAGAVAGGSINGWLMRETTRAARHAYQERWLLLHGDPDSGPPP